MKNQSTPGGSTVTDEGHPTAPPTAAVVEQWLIARLAEELEIDPSAIDVRAKLSRLGLDSAVAVSLSVDLGAHFGMKLAPTLVWDYPTIERLAAHVAELAANADTSPAQ